MKHIRTINTALVFVLLFTLLCVMPACGGKNLFTVAENGNIISPDGVEYKLLAQEGELMFLGEIEFVAPIKGEKKTSIHLGNEYETGMFSLKSAENDNILIRYQPNNEFYTIYRKASLPEFDFSADNIIRLEYVTKDSYAGAYPNPAHATCGNGLVGKEEVKKFFAEIKKQPTSFEAGLYELVRVPNSNGGLKNCYVDYNLQGYYEDEPLLVRKFSIRNFNNIAYAIGYDGAEHVLPEEMLQKVSDSDQ